MLAVVQTTGVNWEQWAVTALPFVLGGLAAIGRWTRNSMREGRRHTREQIAVMADMKGRLEQLERATPGVTPLPETKAVEDARNGAQAR